MAFDKGQELPVDGGQADGYAIRVEVMVGLDVKVCVWDGSRHCVKKMTDRAGHDVIATRPLGAMKQKGLMVK
jgi:hypothetical protein